jgi:hypothetical protein
MNPNYIPQQMTGSLPPNTIDVRDQHGGFTILEPSGDTLWRPGHLLKKSTQGTLQASDPNSFYQLNNNVTKATYKVPGIKYPVLAWFDNITKTRIA